MKRYRCFAFLLLIFTIPERAMSLSEQQALLEALKHNYDIKILHLETSRDSINAASTTIKRLPDVQLQTGISVLPFDTSFISNQIITSGNRREVTTPNSISISQHLPGGGTASGSIAYNKSFFDWKNDSSRQFTELQLSVSQPLLRNAWQSDPVAREIAISRIDNKKFSLEQQLQLFAYCSDIRNCYWQLFEAQALVALYRQEAVYARVRLSTERTRAQLGSVPPLDTLTAQLTYINATARLHDAESQVIQLQEDFTFKCGLENETFALDSTLSIVTSELPPPDTLIARVKQFDPQLRIFTLAADKLQLLDEQLRNSALPNVDFKVSWHRSARAYVPGDVTQVNQNTVIGLIASYNLPGKSKRLALRENTIATDINKLEQEQYARKLHMRLSELRRSWERERRAVDIATSAEEIALKTLYATREGYSVGTVDRLSLDKAENDYRSARTEQLRKQLLMKLLEIVFDEITGITLSKFGVQLQ